MARNALKRPKKKKTRKRISFRKRDSISRSRLAREAQRQIDKFGLSREVAGRVVDEAASQVSRLMTGHVTDFSADRLVKILTRLGSDVTIVIRHPGRLGPRGRVRFKVG